MKKQVQNFNKSDLAIHLSRKFSSLNDETIIEGIDLILQEIINTVALDNRVEIRGFGSFSKKTIRPRKYINPKTKDCLLYTSPSPRDRTRSRMPSSA